MNELPLEIKVIGQLIMYIAKAGGPGELNQMIAVLQEADPIVAGYVRTFARRLSIVGVV